METLLKFIRAKRVSLIQQIFDSGNSKILHPGRLVQINQSTPGVILKFNGKKYSILYNINKNEWNPLRRDVINGRMCLAEQLLPKIEEFSISAISMIFKNTVKGFISDVISFYRKFYFNFMTII